MFRLHCCFNQSILIQLLVILSWTLDFILIKQFKEISNRASVIMSEIYNLKQKNVWKPNVKEINCILFYLLFKQKDWSGPDLGQTLKTGPSPDPGSHRSTHPPAGLSPVFGIVVSTAVGIAEGQSNEVLPGRRKHRLNLGWDDRGP